MFRIELTPEAAADLRAFRRYDQEQIVAGIEEQLPHQAIEPSRNRKQLRPNRLAEWELRIGASASSTMSISTNRWSRLKRLAIGTAVGCSCMARSMNCEDFCRTATGGRC